MVSNEKTCPSKKQIKYIESLGYDGKMPKTIEQASTIIEILTTGGSPKDAQAAMGGKSRTRSCCVASMLIVIICIVAALYFNYF